MFESYILPILLFVGLGIIAAVLLTVASKVFEVKTDERLEKLNEALPGVNCGACGYSGCGAYAEAVFGGAPVNMCITGGKVTADAIGEIMGVEAGEVERKVAFVHCLGCEENTPSKYIFEGTQSCAAANRFYNGSEVCTNGCLGFGDCAAVCPHNAITIKDNLARIDKSLCAGCGLCAKACPDHLITIQSISKNVDVACSSTAIGKVTREVCKAGCIGCKICEKKCPNGAITVTDNLARIDYEKCTSCGICAAACPRHVIVTGCMHNCG